MQKIVFGARFYDLGLKELSAKLYLEAYKLDEAEQKINFLFDNAHDNLTITRALILKSDLLNRRNNYREALQATQEAAEQTSVVKIP